jgi:hypothetical protein
MSQVFRYEVASELAACDPTVGIDRALEKRSTGSRVVQEPFPFPLNSAAYFVREK